jgi:hypothetical protein
MREPITSSGRKAILITGCGLTSGDQLSAKMNYIRQNPVAAGLCAKAEDWLWVIDPFARER